MKWFLYSNWFRLFEKKSDGFQLEESLLYEIVSSRNVSPFSNHEIIKYKRQLQRILSCATWWIREIPLLVVLGLKKLISHCAIVTRQEVQNKPIGVCCVTKLRISILESKKMQFAIPIFFFTWAAGNLLYESLIYKCMYIVFYTYICVFF